MAYLYEKIINGKKHYYLRKAVKENNKIKIKDILYLGQNMPEINIIKNKFPDEFEKSKHNIKKFILHKTYLEKHKKTKMKNEKYFNIEQLSEIKAILDYKRKARNKLETKKRFNINQITEEIYLDLQKKYPLNKKEIEKLITEKKTPKNKSFYDLELIINFDKTKKFLETNKPNINIKLIKKINDNLLGNIFRINGFRTSELKKSPSKIISAKKIEHELKRLISWYNKNKKKINPLALAILFHHKFTKIHPFFYGNGLTARMITNYQLFGLNYPPIIIHTRKKQEYFKALKVADKAIKNDLLSTDMKYYKSLIDFMHKQFVTTYWDNFI